MPDLKTLSEHDSKNLLAGHGLTVVAEMLVRSSEDAAAAAESIGFPVVLKACGASIAHKTERGLVHLGVADRPAVLAAVDDLAGRLTPDDGEVAILVAEMLHATRELIVGVADDEIFGRTIMLGVGGIFAETIADVVFRLLPITRLDAGDMIDDLSSRRVLESFRGELAVDREALVDALLAVAACAASDPNIDAIDVNPMLIVGGRPVAVDALVVTR